MIGFLDLRKWYLQTSCDHPSRNIVIKKNTPFTAVLVVSWVSRGLVILRLTELACDYYVKVFPQGNSGNPNCPLQIH